VFIFKTIIKCGVAMKFLFFTVILISVFFFSGCGKNSGEKPGNDKSRIENYAAEKTAEKARLQREVDSLKKVLETQKDSLGEK